MIFLQIITGLYAVLLPLLIIKYVKKEKTLSLMLKIGAALLFVLVFVKLMVRRAPGLSAGDSKEYFTYITNIFKGRYSGDIPRREAFSMLILSFLGGMSYCLVFTSLLIDSKGTRTINLFFTPLVIMLDIIFYQLIVKGIVGFDEEYKMMHSLILSAVIVTLSVDYSLLLKRELLYKDKTRIFNKKYIPNVLLALILLIVMSIPMSFFSNIFGENGSYSQDFNKNHIIALVITLILFFVPYFTLRNRSREEKKTCLMIMAYGAFYAYFATYCTFNMPLKDYPFHICNTAVVLMLIGLIFDFKPLFYFTYFCNTLGALFALILPNGDDFFKTSMVEYWSNHIIDFVFPFLAVAINVFPKPKFKHMMGALGVFTCYIITVQLCGAYVNYDCNPGLQDWHVDFFFLYGDKFTEVKIIQKLAWNLKFKLNENGELKYVVHFMLGGRRVYAYWLNSLMIYLLFITFSFLLWYFVDRIELMISDFRLTNYKTKLKKEKIGKTSREEVNKILKEQGEKTMIEIKHFSKKYGSSKNYSVKDFSLTIEDGDVFGFIGHNGAGKSTVIKSLVGIQSITEGQIIVNGFDIEKYPLRAKLNIGYVSDNHAVYEKLTGREYINYVADLYQVPKDIRDERINYYSKMFGLTDFLDMESKGYSHGMKQKLVVIASLIHNPKIWVLDEPLTGLDPTSSYEIKECMREHAKNGNIVFFSTHVIEVIEKICNKIAIISHGELMGVYKIEDLKKEKISLESLYLKYVVSDENMTKFRERDIKTTDASEVLNRI